MVDSADLLSDVIADIEFPIPADDFTVYKLARLAPVLRAAKNRCKT